MEGWNEVTRLRCDEGITSLEFDKQSNLIWTGTGNGYLNSFASLSSQLYPYTKFKSSDIDNSIQQIISSNNKVLSLTSTNINVNNKRGITLMNLNSGVDEYYKGFNSMALNELRQDLIISKTNQLFKVNINDPSKRQEYKFYEDASHIDYQPKFLTIGGKNGSLNVFDHHSDTVIKRFDGHKDGISDMDVQGYYLVTSGYSLRHNQYFVDPLVNLYDLRMMKLLTPIPFSMGPSFVKFHPKLPNLVLVGSKSGHFQFLDIFDQSKFQLYQVDNSINNLKISSNGEFLTFNDNYNNILLWSLSNSDKFVNYPIGLEGVSGGDMPTPSIPVDSDVPLNVVGMPYYKDPLLSNYGSNLIFTKELSKVPSKYNEDNLQFTKNEMDTNVNKYYSLNSKDEFVIPFISDGKSRFDVSMLKVPNCYAKLVIKYSKFGIEDFNFNLFNKTVYSGLENNLEHSFINSIIQLYKYQSNFQNLILKNLFKEWLPNDAKTILDTNNFRGSSVLNELGYLFDMLNKAEGKNCKISNFSEVLHSILPPDILSTGSTKSKALRLHKFLLDKLIEDSIAQQSLSNELVDLIVTKHTAITSSIDIKPIDNPTSIIDSLNGSLRHIVSLPDVLSLNVNFTKREVKSLPQHWLSEFIYSEISGNFIRFTDKQRNYKKYKLLGYVAETGKDNLITFININDKWYLFNDFLVQEIAAIEVFDFHRNDKRPVILLYETITREPFLKLGPENDINDEILYRDHFALTIREGYKKQYKLLTRANPPQPGSLVAIDAEFVMLEPDRFEISFDGPKELIQPKKLSLARISVIDYDETPFIDDYIIHTQEIYDYITSFSGIESGDLDPVHSTKNLVTFQTSYRRLWLLLNLGCVFIGHGLQNDFRIINLHVPKAQIRDTVELFFLADFKRKLSLKFLSYVVLHQQVQVGNHDSIEDSKYALKLFKRYQELERTGTLLDELDNIYLEGQKLKFKAPE